MRKTLSASVVATLAILTILPGHMNAIAQSGADSATGTDADREDAAEMASALGIDFATAVTYIDQQPDVWDLEASLRKGDASFAGMFIDYVPEHQIVVLTNGAPEKTTEVVLQYASPDIVDAVTVRKVDYSERSLEESIRQIDKTVSDAVAFAADGDIRTGLVTLIAETATDATVLEDALLEAGIQREAVDVRVSDQPFTQSDFICSGGDGDVCGGEYLHHNGNPECTAGFTVNDGAGHEGPATAAHCDNLLQHEGVDLNFEGGHNEGEYDVQWHTSPGLVDRPKVKDDDGTPRDITAARARVDQTTGTWVCSYGDVSTYSCGDLKSKVFQPPDSCTSTTNPTATYMRVDNPDPTFGDSGGPTYAGNTALGFIKGLACGWNGQYYYMAENYVGILGVSVSLA